MKTENKTRKNSMLPTVTTNIAQKIDNLGKSVNSNQLKQMMSN